MRLALAIASGALLTACANIEKITSPPPTEAAAPEAAATNERLPEGDREAPDRYQLTAPGLWDGRPSFGGIWIAHPDVVEPERVVIRNLDANAAVVGALFQRTRVGSGPPFQVSAEAAEALEMRAGQPAQLQVTALERSEEATASR